MPGTDELENQSGEEQNESNESGDGTEQSSDESTQDKGDKGKLDAKTQKRISDLQAKADAAEARANRLEKLNADKGSQSGGDPERDALRQDLREASLDAMFGEFPLLKQYGIERALIEGSTRSEIRESASAVVALIESVSTKVRNEVLAANGLSADQSGNTNTPPKDYGSMSDEDFTKLLNSM